MILPSDNPRERKNMAHSHGRKQADFWTGLSALMIGISSFFNCSVYFGGIIDNAGEFDEDIFNLSMYGLVFGMIISLIIALGSGYSNFILNLHHQPNKNKKIELEEEKDDAQQALVSIVPQNNYGTNNNNEDDSIDNPRLKWWQHIALASNWVSDSVDIAGLWTLIIMFGLEHEDVPQWAQALTQAGTFFIGALASFAQYRTCKNAMEIKAQLEHPRGQEIVGPKPHSPMNDDADRWTNLSAAMLLITSMVNSTIYFGDIIDNAADFNKFFFNLSYYGLAFGGGVSIIIATGAMYSHQVLNRHHQILTQEMNESDSGEDFFLQPISNHEHHKKGSLKVWQYLALVGHLIADSVDIAGLLTLITTYGLKNERVPRWGKALTQVGTFGVIGVPASIADYRNCERAMKEQALRDARDKAANTVFPDVNTVFEP